MVVATDVSHEDVDLAVVDLAAVTTPLALNPHQMRTPLGKTTRIKGDDASGFAEPINYLSNQHLNQRAMIPRRSANEVLHDQALGIDQRRDVLGILGGKWDRRPVR